MLGLKIKMNQDNNMKFDFQDNDIHKAIQLTRTPDDETFTYLNQQLENAWEYDGVDSFKKKLGCLLDIDQSVLEELSIIISKDGIVFAPAVATEKVMVH